MSVQNKQMLVCLINCILYTQTAQHTDLTQKVPPLEPELTFCEDHDTWSSNAEGTSYSEPLAPSFDASFVIGLSRYFKAIATKKMLLNMPTKFGTMIHISHNNSPQKHQRPEETRDAANRGTGILSELCVEITVDTTVHGERADTIVVVDAIAPQNSNARSSEKVNMAQTWITTRFTTI